MAENSNLNEENPIEETELNSDPKSTDIPLVSEGRKPKGVKMIFSQFAYAFRLIFTSIRSLFLMVINLQKTTDALGTISTIKAGIVIKGYNIWILVASTVLACIGLDTNSVAVIIGAMLISPLMSPILGIGLAVGINDRETLRNSLYNFGIAVAVSLLAAVIYFWLTPLGRETAEMAARTKPTLLDVMVGFFGGVAGIVAGSRKEKTNAIPGVAIATALMPPLCVAGFGLAKGNMDYFAGAFYLFFLNAVFISLSTFLIVRYLKFPLKVRVTANLRKNFLRGVLFFVMLMLVPAVLLFVEVVQLQNRQSKIEQFLEDKFGTNRIAFSVEREEFIETDSVNYLRVTVASSIYLPQDSVELYDAQIRSKYNLKNTELILIQTTADPNDRIQTLNQIREEVAEQLSSFERDRTLAFERQKEIEALKDEIRRIQDGALPVLEIREDVRDIAPELASVAFGMLRNANLTDTLSRKDPNRDQQEFTLRFTWRDSLPLSVAEDRKTLIRGRLKNKYNLENLRLLDVNAPFLNPK